MKQTFILFVLSCLSLKALTIKVDYRFDESGFFDNPQARAALEAAAARWSRIVDQTLLPVNVQDDDLDFRFTIRHPATGNPIDVSVAASRQTDRFVELDQRPADFYLDGFTLEAGTWILFPGARNNLGGADSAAGPIVGGLNFNSVFEDPNSPLNRGFNAGQESLPVLGGFVSFRQTANWNFDLTRGGNFDEIDFYTTALHEIGHGFGLNASAVNDFENNIKGDQYVGLNAVEAYNADNNASLDYLLINFERVDFHWRDNIYQSFIFELGRPNLIGSRRDQMQPLLMEPIVDFTGTLGRVEISNVEIGAMKDLGWSLITEDPEFSLPLSVSANFTGKNITLTVPSELGQIYTVQTSVNAVDWLDVTPPLVGDGAELMWQEGEAGFFDPHGPAANLDVKFYRVIRE